MLFLWMQQPAKSFPECLKAIDGILVIADNLSDGLVVDFARSVVSKIPERTKSELKSSKSGLKGFANSLV